MKKNKEVSIRGVSVKCGKGVDIPPDTELVRCLDGPQFIKVGDFPKIGSGVIIHTGAILGDNVTIGNDVVIGTNVIIGDNCRIEDGRILSAPDEDDPELVGVLTRKEARRKLGVCV